MSLPAKLAFCGWSVVQNPLQFGQSVPEVQSPISLAIQVIMVSFWGSKNGEERQGNDDQAQEGEHSTNTPRSSQPEPDERSRLLPPGRDGFLSPDDPAVSLVSFDT